MKLKVALWAIIGFFVPLFWGIASFILFNAKGIWTTAYWYLVYATCPFWLLPGLAGEILMPLLNAVLYGTLAYSYLRIQKVNS